ncbi:MAG: ATP-grasp domain-containing protein [Bacteroidia bacterium]|nr:ATP-grasp domain-containing protein [Bacteroidia bacterium]MCF8427522.1 ATP-grasp domain-containing protein [Bacteroidia bacterium]MCF8446730.1 ATP-grasp domain-containing protein [Bacteroidia bacterium]
MKIGIFFGGNSREREVSFAGGRTVYDNLDKTLFEAIPIFVDSFNNFILLDWHFIYKGSIRDFYPSVEFLKGAKHEVQVYAENLKSAYIDNGKTMARKIGKLLAAEDLKGLIDFAFLALHGNFGEDGTLQGLLEWYGIPYSGSGILPSSIGMNKRLQKQWMQAAGMKLPKYFSFPKSGLNQLPILQKEAIQKVGLPFVVKPANQGSSVGVSVIKTDNLKEFVDAIHKAFFIQTITPKDWIGKSILEKTQFIQKITDVKEGIGLPAKIKDKMVYHPDELWAILDKELKGKVQIQLESVYSETEVLIESFIEGREFSCIVLRNEDGSAVALPPTEIVKGEEVYDYKSKYLPGLSRKITPIDLAENKIQEIRKACVDLFGFFNFHVYARIDGFLSKDGDIFLNDPNTTSGMMPSSFFFHQAAEIGLNPSQFLTYIIRTSIQERISSQSVNLTHQTLLARLDAQLTINKSKKGNKKRVAVLMGGYSTERHISVESGRNIYEKLASSEKYQPFPVFVTGNDEAHELYLLPIQVMLKDNADDIREKVMHYHRPEIMNTITKECEAILTKYSNTNLFEPKKISYKELKQKADAVFIALHGRPGEDGTVQQELNKIKLPFNGSDVASSQITINKYDTNELLKKKGLLVADHWLIYEEDFEKNQKAIVSQIEKVGYPLIAKPADDGCSSAVKKIKNRAQLIAYAQGVFRPSFEISEEMRVKLQLGAKEEFPKKKFFLVEKFVEKGKAKHFLEVTGGMLTHYKNGKLFYETFEPSETLAESEILSLEEKFLAGQGQNITPARYAKTPLANKSISKQVQAQLKKAAQVLGVEGYCRIDAFVRIFSNNKVEVVFIEVNSLPGMTPATAIFHQCALNNYKPYEFIDQILQFGEARLKSKK